jgi:uncharacterized protein (TIRG00374 family)
VTSSTSKLALRLLIGVGLLAVVFQFADVGEALRAIRNVDGWWLAASIACYVATRALMAIKWWVLLGGGAASVSYATVQRALCLSDYYSLLFPNTLAVDVTRVVLLRHHARGTGFMIAAILADRVINVATTAATALVALGALYAWRGALPFSPAVANAVIVVALLVIVAACAVASSRLTSLVIASLRATARVVPQLARLPGWIDAAARVHAAMATMLTSRGTLFPAFALAAAMVIARVASAYFLFFAVGAPQSFALNLVLVPIVVLIALLPITVFGLGLKDGAFVFFFGGAGVAASLALAVSLASYAVIIAANVLLGLVASVVGPPLPTAATAAAAKPGSEPP